MATWQYTETTQADFSSGTLQRVTATAGGSLQLVVPGAPTFTRASIAYKQDLTQVSSGVPRYETIGGRTGITLEEGTTNLYTANESDVETGAGDWTPGVNCDTLVQASTYKVEGTYSLRAQSLASGGFNFQWVRDIGISSGVDYAASYYLRTPDISFATTRLKLVWLDGAHAVLSNNNLDNSNTTTGTFTRYSGVATSDASGVYVSVRPNLLNATAGAQRGFYDALQLEQKSYVTSWQIGGTPRVAEYLTLPTLSLDVAGTIECYFRLTRSPGSGRPTQQIFQFLGSALHIGLYVDQSTGQLRTQMGALIKAGTTSIVKDTWYHVSLQWWLSGASYKGKLLLNGVAEIAEFTASDQSGTYTQNAVGSTYGSGSYLDGYVSHFHVSEGVQVTTDRTPDYYTIYYLGFEGDLNYITGGYRLSPVVNIDPGDKITSSTVTIIHTVPGGCSEASNVNLTKSGTPLGWVVLTSGSAIPGVTVGEVLSLYDSFQLREELVGGSAGTPSLDSLSLSIVHEPPTLTVNDDSGRVECIVGNIGTGGQYYLVRSYCSDYTRIDLITLYDDGIPLSEVTNLFTGSATVYDIPDGDWTYYYWLQRVDGGAAATGPVTGKLIQPRLIHTFKRKPWGSQRKMACELCGFTYLFRELKRGWVPPYQAGENYILYSLDPSHWTIDPTYLHVWDHRLFPQVEYPDGGKRVPGAPEFILKGTYQNLVTLAVGPNPVAECTLRTWWHWEEKEDGTITIAQAGGLTVSHTINPFNGWVTFDDDWVMLGGVNLVIQGKMNTSNGCYVTFGGAQIFTTELSDFAVTQGSPRIGSNGGYLRVCPDCWSGFRRRNPWD